MTLRLDSSIYDRYSVGDDVLASNQRNYPGEVANGGSALTPHSNEEVRGQSVNFIKVEEEWLESSGCRVYVIPSSRKKPVEAVPNEETHNPERK